MSVSRKHLGDRARLWLIHAVFAGYKQVLGPALHVLSPTPSGCPYQPTCSEYAALACAQQGLLRGGAMTAWRLLRCNPLSQGGWDPVPPGEAGSPPSSVFQAFTGMRSRHRYDR